MRILFVATPRALSGAFETAVAALHSRGHQVAIVAEGEDGCPSRRRDAWSDSVTALRGYRDYARFLRDPLKAAERLRKRALLTTVKRVSAGELTGIAAPCPRCGREIRNDGLGAMLSGLEIDQAIDRVFALAEDEMPSDAAYDAFLQSHAPDVVLLTPMTSFGSGQADIVKSCRRFGIPTALAVPTLGALTMNGLIHASPDRVFVWNDEQRSEAVNLHDVPADRVVVTGAAAFDRFFAMRESESRQEFCARYGLDAAEPIVTYLCSSDFVHDDEAVFVRDWIQKLGADGRLNRCGLVIRPHPRARRTWTTVPVDQWQRIAFIPAKGDPLPSLHAALTHCDAAVALNTTAMLEAAILGKPVFTITPPELAHGQSEVHHFQYLLRENGGFVARAPDLDAHIDQLAGAIAGTGDAAMTRAFVGRFLRPAGIQRPVGELMAETIIGLGTRT
jgi:hypothetical protein